MKEICNNLFLGNQSDYENQVRFEEGWFVIHACKEPYHRQALAYRGSGAPKNHPEYLIASRNNRLILNLIDVDNMSYIPKEIIDAALSGIETNISDKKVLMHCNQGQSRSAIIGLLYLASKGLIPNSAFAEAEEAFKQIYPGYNPGKGMFDFANFYWEDYTRT